MTTAPSTLEIEALAAEIGENIYIDVAKWHLYLAEAHLHLPLAERLYPLLQDENLTPAGIRQVLGEISVSLGGGQRQLTLGELIPAEVQGRLLTLLEDYQAR
ncbi:MAG: DUF3181 family protein [Cyanobacteriota bacterium]|jgi:hypothetical protein